MVVDAFKGSRNKFKFDEEHDQWRLSKMLPQAAYFPFDFGFIPPTMADDGDPLDVLLIAEEPTFAGCIIPVRLISVLEAEKTEKGQTFRNDRLVAVDSLGARRANSRRLTSTPRLLQKFAC